MKKRDLRSIYDLALSEITETEPAFEQNRPNPIFFREEERQPTRTVVNKKGIPINQTWTLPNRTYSWFPYYTLYMTSK